MNAWTLRAPVAIAADVLALIGALVFTIEHPRGALFIFAGAYALGIIGCDLWSARHKIAAAFQVE